MSNSSFSVNPFTLVFDGLWSLLEDSPQFAALVKEGNRIHYNKTENNNPYKTQIQDSDLPEVQLIPEGMQVNLFESSSTSKVVRRYSWLISTGDVRVHNFFHQIEWSILIGMTGWQKKLGALIWPLNTGQPFVKLLRTGSINEGLSDPQLNRSIRGWSTVWPFEIEMYFKSSDLQDLLGY